MQDPTQGSIYFDRAAGYYDQTRGLPPDVLACVVRLLEDELGNKQPCLEIGVGTGRIALPLAEAGVQMAGIDVSRPMLDVLVTKGGGAPSFPVAIADATRLPFADDSVGSGLCVHVLHLIPAWRVALAELVRAIRAGGVVLVDVGGDGRGVFRELHERFANEAGITADARPGASGAAAVDHELSTHGAVARPLPVVRALRRDKTYEQIIGDLEEGRFSNTWSVGESARRAAGAAVRAWAKTRFGALDQELEHELEITYRAYDLP